VLEGNSQRVLSLDMGAVGQSTFVLLAGTYHEESRIPTHSLTQLSHCLFCLARLQQHHSLGDKTVRGRQHSADCAPSRTRCGSVAVDTPQLHATHSVLFAALPPLSFACNAEQRPCAVEQWRSHHHVST